MDSSINSEGLSPKPPNTFGQDRSPDIHHGVPKDWKFWCIIFSLTLSILLTAIELVSYLFFLLASLGQRGEAEAKWDLNHTIRRAGLVQRSQRSSAT